MIAQAFSVTLDMFLTFPMAVSHLLRTHLLIHATLTSTTLQQ